jgi:ribosomal-protein-alanine N-acetyltransferase
VRPEQLAAIHARAMTAPPPWDADTFRSFLGTSGVFLVTEGAGFALGRVILDEAELLTLAVDPDHRGAGLGRACLARFEATAVATDATRAFLEVAATNTPARALYAGSGWTEDGRRRGYYVFTDGTSTDAILMSKSLI